MNDFNNGFQGSPPFPNQGQPQVPPNWNMPVISPAFMNWAYVNGVNPTMSGNPNIPNMWNSQQTPQQANATPNNTQSMPQQSQPQNNRQTIACGVVSGPDDIKPGEVPMNGGVGMFVKNDLSEIYVKQWGSDGNIHTRCYVESIVDAAPVAVQTEAGPSLQDVMDNVNARFEKMETLISSLNSNRRQNQNNGQKNNQNKEVANNG